MSILIVEDNRHLRRVLREMLHEAFPAEDLLEADDGRGALAACGGEPPEVVLMDISLPDANGIELTARLGRLLPQACVLIVSSHGSDSHRAHARLAGAAGYIQKDDIPEQLLPAVARLLERHCAARREAS
jgi:two-component system invasion response regulator UvrY